MSGLANLHPMTPGEARNLLAGIGYRADWSLDELREAVPSDMLPRVALALRITAAAEHAEADALEREAHL